MTYGIWTASLEICHKELLEDRFPIYKMTDRTRIGQMLNTQNKKTDKKTSNKINTNCNPSLPPPLF